MNPDSPSAPAPEIVTVNSRRVACDGVGGALGHPRVWLAIGESDFAECLYCDRRFVFSAAKQGHGAVPGVYEAGSGH